MLTVRDIHASKIFDRSWPVWNTPSGEKTCTYVTVHMHNYIEKKGYVNWESRIPAHGTSTVKIITAQMITFFRLFV